MRSMRLVAVAAAICLAVPAHAVQREVKILGDINLYRSNLYVPSGVQVGDDYVVSLFYDDDGLGSTRTDVNGPLFTSGVIKIGQNFSYDIGSTNIGQSKSVITFQTQANGSQIIDLNFGARFGNSSGSSASPRDYVHIRLTGAANTLFNADESVLNWDDNTTVSVAGSYISFVADRRNYDVRGDAREISFDAVPQVQPDPVTGVPEPATWATLALGFGLAGAALRRRRTAPA